MSTEKVLSKEIIIEQAILQNIRGGGTCYVYVDMCRADYCSCEAGLSCGSNICGGMKEFTCYSA